jgi:hypothetical protein
VGPLPARPDVRLVRALAVAAAAVIAASCSSGGSESSAESSAGSSTAPRPSPSSAPSTTSTSEPRLTAPARYLPVDGEPAPEAKQLAADALQTIGTYPEGAGTSSAARSRLADMAVAGGVVDEAAPLLVPDAASAVEIVYPQLGGLTDVEASVMVVFRHRLMVGGTDQIVTRTADVRLVAGPGGWSVSAIASIGGDPPPQVPPSPVAQALLSHGAIDLPDSARWDIEAGRIDERVLQLLVDLAAHHTLSITVLATGHPHNVFATDTVSNHTLGRGVDIWAVDGQPVVSQRDTAGALHGIVADLLIRGVTELGSPWDLDGPGGASFTNTVHQDHLHLAFDA